MSKTLIIAEKPSVAREIAPLVNATGRRDGYIEGPTHLVSWAVGHLVGIAEPEDQHEVWKGKWTLDQLPIIPPKFKLAVLAEGRKQFAVLNRLLNLDDVDTVINATDAGREGELIFRRIYLMAECSKPVKRFWASDMTEEGLKKSLNKLLPDSNKRNLGLASFARAEADWLIGMNFSRIFTIKANSLVSVGRVQTPVLKLLADRRRDVEHFVPQNYWTVEGSFGKPNAPADEQEPPFAATWHRPPDLDETRISKEEQANRIASECEGKDGVVESTTSRKGTTKPPLPFDLTTLQREANTRFGYSAKDTLTIAQALYEQKKLLTYPRTDSRHLTKELFAEILNYFRAIYHLYPDETVPAVERVREGKKFPCVDDKKVTDHHAIIPTANKADLDRLSGEERNIYDMVCRRFIAAFSMEATFSASTVHIVVEDHTFIAKGKVFKDRGWLQVEPWRAAEDNPLPALRKGSKVSTEAVNAVRRQTKAPAHFTDASLLAAMETAGKFVEDDELRNAMKERGLGTPATRAQIIETLLSRGYVNKDGKKLICSDRGLEVADIVSALLPEVSSPEMTGQWEKKLKDIEAAQYTYPDFMREIRTMVSRGVGHIKGRNVTSLIVATKARSLPVREPDGNCPLCGGEIMEREKGYSCSRWKREDGGCLFVIWKSMFGRELPEEIVRELLATGRTAQPLDFVSKAGKPYSARLVLEEGQVKPEFVNDRPYGQQTANYREESDAAPLQNPEQALDGEGAETGRQADDPLPQPEAPTVTPEDGLPEEDTAPSQDKEM
ncbi:DNA topoisomerase 3 [Desulfovibrio mangrovi]|uniref:type IA DNA topoisomerase n=1 Tax=Desulfovibrio mangrovi TaxID=2976983 RepID=UPI00224750EF|nr:type IA DNA topoisomerase [Desulfovibrio mangrovi]UZP68707.1 DNA topoisomerase 3 [Desulfovibrio mangrovi]